MSYAITEQTDRAVEYRIKAQSAIGTAESGSGATVIPFTSSPGINQENADVQSQISRVDLLTQLGDYGQGSSPFTLDSELIVGAHDLIDQAVMRGTYGSASTVDETNLGAVTGISGKVITFTNGTVLTDGVKPGMVLTPLSGFHADDINEHFFVEAVTTTTITLDKAPTSATPSSFEFRLEKTCIDGTTDRGFTIEEYFSNIDKNAVAEGIRFGEYRFFAGPNQPIQRSWRGRGRQMITGSGQNFSSPTTPTGLALSDANKELSIAGAVVGKVSAFEVNYSRPDFLPPTSTPIAEDVGLGAVRLTGSLTILKSSLVYPAQFISRLKGFSIGLKFFEPAASGPNPIQALYMPNCRWINLSPSGAGRDGFSTIRLGFEAGVDLRGGAAEKTMIRLSNWSA